MDINKFIDFKSLFISLANDPDYGAKHIGKLAVFISANGPENFELEIEDCELTDKFIHFSFGKYIEIAHEGSSGYVASCNYYITYDREKEKFISCDYEQG